MQNPKFKKVLNIPPNKSNPHKKNKTKKHIFQRFSTLISPSVATKPRNSTNSITENNPQA